MKWFMTWLSPMLVFLCCHGYNWSSLNLPVSHVPYFFTNNPDIRDLCKQDEKCPYKTALKEKRCWGYERECAIENRLSLPECPGDSRGWSSTKEDQLDQFWKGADFGYVLERRKEMKQFCVPKSQDDSSLECAKYTRYCRAKNIYLDFRRATFTDNENFKEDFLLEGEIGGHCELHKNLLKAEGEHKSPLQSWFAEVEHFSSLQFKPINNESCDTILDKPVMFMKLDAGVNMFHHYCDFINFYASLHINNSFSTDIYMINWDTENKIRITILARNTKYRNIMNQDELISALNTVGEYEVRLVVYKFRDMPFLEQVKVSHNSDVFIGMHGAGLTHMLYQPDWGSVIELFHCGDPNCYSDLARLRGLKYFTWEKTEKLTQEDEGHHPQLGAHQKFTNYAFDVVEFMRLVTSAAEHVKSHPEFIQARKLKYTSSSQFTKDEL
ncbi:EGF domain-specific O-linked N-acetylglucosamine transferase-like [Mercenaria mercenaria]|uniref:EGF domain-specific O-linked N-acetylglucosamine transferase-like n=1 Tax=Mercenaria mercenaria TaxID=6596 RepID=UPI00234F2BB6|nr:EGF domain-specific O-linked N-acetylglucosamine transferase-like [Mercenaria mercenaria]